MGSQGPAHSGTSPRPTTAGGTGSPTAANAATGAKMSGAVFLKYRSPLQERKAADRRTGAASGGPTDDCAD